MLDRWKGGSESPVRLSFKLFADETRATRRFARRREALTGSNGSGEYPAMDTMEEVDTGPNGRREDVPTR